jgi:hypothetical protein
MASYPRVLCRPSSPIPAYFQTVFHPDPSKNFAIHFKGHENLYDNMFLKKLIIKMNVKPKIVLKSKANIKTSDEQKFSNFHLHQMFEKRPHRSQVSLQTLGYIKG